MKQDLPPRWWIAVCLLRGHKPTLTATTGYREVDSVLYPGLAHGRFQDVTVRCGRCGVVVERRVRWESEPWW
jgi:hypothetical protein